MARVCLLTERVGVADADDLAVVEEVVFVQHGEAAGDRREPAHQWTPFSQVGFSRVVVRGFDRAPRALLRAQHVTGLIPSAMELWEHLAGTVARFTPAVSVAVSPRSYLCPPGWVGIVVIGDGALATAPDQGTARVVEQALSGLPVASLTDTAVLRRRLRIAEILGPAVLAYLEPADFRPQLGDAITGQVDLDDVGLRQFLAAADTDDVEESGMREITSQVFAVREHGQVVAAAGYRDWPCGTAHLSVLTAAAARGRGLARAAASAAVAHAIEEGKLPQWRARPQESRRVARALGFRELGSQVSIQLATCGLGWRPPAR
jgi:RimJ/RimL family protein N-acetyltransferase